jgi:hypothetical protein
VYAALGLTSEADLVTVDYEVSVPDLLTSVTKNWMDVGPMSELPLRILGLYVLQPSSELPSWVVDWTSRRDTFCRWPLYKDNRLLGDKLGEKHERVYSAGADIL